MNGCFRARKVVIQLRYRKGPTRTESRRYTLMVPARWSRSTLLGYVRACHPGETVRIAEWWEPGFYMPDPADLSDYQTGVLG